MVSTQRRKVTQRKSEVLWGNGSREAHNRKGWIIDVSMLVDGAKIDIFDCIRVDFLPGSVL